MTPRGKARPAMAESITVSRSTGRLRVPDRVIIPYIMGDGIGADIMPVALQVWNTAVDKAYALRRDVEWRSCAAGGAAGLPVETLETFREHVVAVKGPLTTPVGGGIRSLNVALRQALDLYICQRPVRWFPGVPAPVRHPEWTDMVVFRENTEDIYAGIEWAAGSEGAVHLAAFLEKELGVRKIRRPGSTGLGVKPVSREGSRRLVRAALRYAIEQDRPSVTLVHKGNIMKFTEGAFRDWGLAVAREEFGAVPDGKGPWCTFVSPKTGRRILVKDCLADNFLQEILLQPRQHSVIATLNLNGDYISDALAACVGGIGISPGANWNGETGRAVFEATHGTAPQLAGRDCANPTSLILSGEMMFRYLGWTEAADLIIRGLEAALRDGVMTADLAAQREDGGSGVGCQAFGQALRERM